jgi:hypothetical protein
MIRSLIWHLLGWPGPIPLYTRTPEEYYVALGGAVLLLALYPLWFRVAFAIGHRGRTARASGWIWSFALALAWSALALDWFNFNTPFIVFPGLLLVLIGIGAWLISNRV